MTAAEICAYSIKYSIFELMYISLRIPSNPQSKASLSLSQLIWNGMQISCSHAFEPTQWVSASKTFLLSFFGSSNQLPAKSISWLLKARGQDLKMTKSCLSRSLFWYAALDRGDSGHHHYRHTTRTPTVQRRNKSMLPYSITSPLYYVFTQEGLEWKILPWHE